MPLMPPEQPGVDCPFIRAGCLQRLLIDNDLLPSSPLLGRVQSHRSMLFANKIVGYAHKHLARFVFRLRPPLPPEVNALPESTFFLAAPTGSPHKFVAGHAFAFFVFRA
jgi:hypothetical protein